MKNLSLILITIIALKGFSQTTINKDIGEFSTVKVFDLINVTMISSQENRVEISGDNKEDVEVINKNGKLKIRMAINESYDGNDTHIKLYYTAVDVIDANEGAKIIVKDKIDQYEIDFKAQEGGEIEANVNSTYANLRAVTGGIISVTGKSKHQNISIYTGGIINTEDFITERTEVNVNAGGEAYINATKYVEVKVKAGGNVTIYGNPETVSEKRILGGKVKIVKE